MQVQSLTALWHCGTGTPVQPCNTNGLAILTDGDFATEVALKPATAQHRMLVGGGDGAAARALPNVADVLAGMVQLGDGVVKAVKVPQSAHGLRRAAVLGAK